MEKMNIYCIVTQKTTSTHRESCHKARQPFLQGYSERKKMVFNVYDTVYIDIRKLFIHISEKLAAYVSAW